MRFAVTALAALLAALLAGAACLFGSLWAGSLVSSTEVGAYFGLIIAIAAVPVGAISAGWLLATSLWQWARARPQPPA